jgi:hypothetical protein
MSIARTIYVALAGLVVLAIWIVRETGDPVKDNPPARRLSRRGELLKTHKTVQRQIEALETGYGRRSSGLREQSLHDLHDILREVDAELAALEPGG